MEKEKNYIPIVITFGIIVFVVLVGLYYIGKSSNNSPLENIQTQDSQTSSVIPTQSNQVASSTPLAGTIPCNGTNYTKCKAGSDFVCPSNGGEAYCQLKASNQPATNNNKPADDLFSRQQTCAQMLSGWEAQQQAQFDQFYNGGTMEKPFLANFVVGYSPSLQACVGGFNTANSGGSACGTVFSQYMIFNLTTNKQIGTNYLECSNASSPTHQRQDYLNKLSELTNGQLK